MAKTVLKFAGGAMLFALIFAWVAWIAIGGRIYMVETPSMSPNMPVGALIFVKPTTARLHVGEVISFRPPTEQDTIFTHRIYAVLPSGSVETKGDLNSAPDSWTVPRSAVIGAVKGIVPDLGWFYHSVAWMALGVIATAVVAKLSKPSSRLSVYVLGLSAVIATPVVFVRPLVRGDLLVVSNFHRRVRGLLVNTGVLPVSFQANGGAEEVAQPGHAIFLYAPRGSRQSSFKVHMAAALNWWEILVTIGICLLPLLILTSKRARPLGEEGEKPGLNADDGGENEPSRTRLQS